MLDLFGAVVTLVAVMRTAKLLNDACELLSELEHNVTDDYVKYRLDELFREVIKQDERTLTDTRDIAIRIMEHLIQQLAWDKTDQPESEWYPSELQDDIQNIINEALGIKNED
jgi:hypothetical protein